MLANVAASKTVIPKAKTSLEATSKTSVIYLSLKKEKISGDK